MCLVRSGGERKRFLDVLWGEIGEWGRVVPLQAPVELIVFLFFFLFTHLPFYGLACAMYGACFACLLFFNMGV